MPIPSLHMWGDADEHIPSWTSKVLAERFDNPQVHAHAGPVGCQSIEVEQVATVCLKCTVL